MNRFYNFFLQKGVDTPNSIEFFIPDALSASYEIAFPTVPPADGDVMVYDSTGSRFDWVNSSGFGSGTVESVALSLPNVFNITGSPVTSTGTLTAAWVNQSGNVILASPSNGSSGEPVFRALVDADLPAAIAAGRIDGVLTKANIPNGTNAISFQLNGVSGAIISDTTGTGFIIHQSDGVTVGDLTVRNLTITGRFDQEIVETINLGDAFLKFLSAVTGTPTQNAGLIVERGTLTDAGLTWNEATDTWEANDGTTSKSIARRQMVSITNADLVAGVYTFTHNIGKEPIVQIIGDATQNNDTFGLTTRHVNVNSCTIDFTRALVGGVLSGTWRIIALG